MTFLLRKLNHAAIHTSQTFFISKMCLNTLAAQSVFVLRVKLFWEQIGAVLQKKYIFQGATLFLIFFQQCFSEVIRIYKRSISVMLLMKYFPSKNNWHKIRSSTQFHLSNGEEVTPQLESIFHGQSILFYFQFVFHILHMFKNSYFP